VEGDGDEGLDQLLPLGGGPGQQGLFIGGVPKRAHEVVPTVGVNPFGPPWGPVLPGFGHPRRGSRRGAVGGQADFEMC
jgi:hypothetical protein